MKTLYMNLEKILDLDKWQGLQDSLALVTGLAIITVDYRGQPITAHSGRRPFCSHMRQDPALEAFCHKCDSRGGLEAVRLNAPYIYRCHCRIVDVAIPISIDGKYVGAIMAGQVKLPEQDVTPLEQILVLPGKDIIDSAELKSLYCDIPALAYQKIEAIANMLFHLCQYILEEAMNKNLLLEMYEKMLPLKNESPAGTPAGGYSLGNIEHLKKELGNLVTNAYVKPVAADVHLCKNPLLRPVFAYMNTHKSQSVSQKEMADLCHISAGHFSRLFAKETGDTFKNYQARQKVEWAKQLLQKTDLPITQISDDLGFSEPGYFIKTFKKFENLTPVMYRRYIAEGK